MTAKWLMRNLFGVLLLMLASVSAACQSRPSTTQPDLDRIVGAGTVRVCSTGDYRPLTYRDPVGQWSGMDIDLAGNLAHRLGVTLQLVPTTWSALMNDVANRCDLAMGGISITLDRARTALFSAPYLRDGKAAIVRCTDLSKYQSLADIDRSGVRVIVNPDGTNAQFDQAHLHNAAIVTHRDNNTIFDEIIADTADVMITDATEIRWQTMQHAQLCGVNVEHPFDFAQKAYLIRRSGTSVQQWVDQWLNIIANDGTFAAISQKWLGRVVGP